MFVSNKEIKEHSTGDSNSSSYRSILKATSLFGGVQVYQILIQIIRSKFIAILIGPLGVGIIGLYTTALDVFKRLTSLGLAQSAVREVSAAYGTGVIEKVSKVSAVISKLVWVTGLLGTCVVLLFSPVISKTTFGCYDYIVPISILSITLLFDQLSAGQMVLLQGTRRLRDLAKSSALGVTIGLIVSVPIYYIWNINGIVPTLLISSITSLILTWYYSKRINIPKIRISIKEAFVQAGTMIKMGIALCLSSVLVAINAYAIRGFIRFIDGAEMVGLYSAGAAITTTYVGMVFSAMSTDFYPRLAAVCNDDVSSKRIVNQQGEIAALILGPLILLCVVYMPLIIRILYSEKFIPVSDYIMLAAVGMMFRLPAWLSSVQFIAKGMARYFTLNETISGLYNLVISIIGYWLGGLVGLGISFIIFNLVYFIHMYIMTRVHFKFSFNSDFSKVFVLQTVFIIAALVLSLVFSNITRYVVGGCLAVIVLILSFRGLSKRLGMNLLKRNI
jgi:PST family polysaccharide transporter